MKIRIIRLLIPVLFSFSLSGQVSTESKPKLIVLITVDGLRGDLLYKYQEGFKGGFRTLIDKGLNFRNATQDHANTVTAAGHASISTGASPSAHGIVGNDWFEKVEGEWKYIEDAAVNDDHFQLVGFPKEEGVSPHKLAVSGLADWLGEVHPTAKVVSIAGKDRAAIMLAGKTRGYVYWFDDDLYGFGSSTFYMSDYPKWALDFNKGIRKNYPERKWECAVPSSLISLARPDSSFFENDGIHIAFPHSIDDFVGKYRNRKSVFKWYEETPIVDQINLDFAKKAIQELELGKNLGTDFLALGLSATDRIGHAFGPESLEQLDNLLRLDKELGLFISFLNSQVGEENYVLALTADHGFATIPENRTQQKLNRKRYSEEEVNSIWKEAKVRAGKSVDTSDALQSASEVFLASGMIDRIVTISDLQNPELQDSVTQLFRRSYFDGRSTTSLVKLGVAGVKMAKGALGEDYGSTHGTVHWYDRHVPLIFMGMNIEPETRHDSATTRDIAPTLAFLCGIPFPDELEGKVLSLTE